MKLKKILTASLVCLMMTSLINNLYAQKPYRVGTSAATFLEVGYGPEGNAMGDAYTSVASDVSSIYWNPAGLASMYGNQATFCYQPWLADINTMFTAGAINVEGLGTFGLSIIAVDYGKMDVTTLSNQSGTGETFSASDIAVSLAYSRKLADWFSFGMAAKYVNSTIWHSSASAVAFDLGVLINTGFFSPTKNMEDGLNIGMSVSNYGTQLRYDGMDLTQPIDPTPSQHGDYKDVRGEYKLAEWELPLIFRLGTSLTVINSGNHRLLLSVDAIHPNNNSESVNIGGRYSVLFPGVCKVTFAGGYKALFMDQSQYGFSFGVGIDSYLLYKSGYRISYAYRTHKTLGGTSSYGVNIFF